jgi:uncharacterized protein
LNLDLHEDPKKRDSESKFVQLLWERGIDFENEVISKLQIPFTDLHALEDKERERQTKEAMNQKAKLIYAGRIRAGNLLGEPDILRWDDNMGYVAGDIKSGAGEEGDEDIGNEKPKRHYAVQLALYTDILETQELGKGRLPFVWDVHGNEVIYDLKCPKGLGLHRRYGNCTKRNSVKPARSFPSRTRPCLHSAPTASCVIGEATAYTT